MPQCDVRPSPEHGDLTWPHELRHRQRQDGCGCSQPHPSSGTQPEICAFPPVNLNPARSHAPLLPCRSGRSAAQRQSGWAGRPQCPWLRGQQGDHKAMSVLGKTCNRNVSKSSTSTGRQAEHSNSRNSKASTGPCQHWQQRNHRADYTKDSDSNAITGPCQCRAWHMQQECEQQHRAHRAEHTDDSNNNAITGPCQCRAWHMQQECEQQQCQHRAEHARDSNSNAIIGR
eukprot:1159373-Pelagomonas_calceolata.AAC.7